jgi:hypothetical protein
MTGVRRVLYGLHRLRGKEAVLIVEGEKDADRLWSLNLPATTNVGGAGKWTDDYTRQLEAAGVKRVMLVPDNDDAGRAHARAVAQSCSSAGINVRVLTLPGLPPKGDVSDFLATHDRAEFGALMASAPSYQPGEATAPANRAPVLVCAADVEPEEISWVWPQRIAKGKLTLLLGDPGVGKSTLLIDVLARISTGAEWPDGGRAPLGTSVLLACEDGLADTLIPRMIQQGANRRNMFVLQAATDEEGRERHFALDRDLPQLRVAIERHRPVVIAIDPVSAYFGTDRDSYKDPEVRAVLAPLCSLAEETGTAIVGLVHPTKASQQKALYRVMGSQAFAATARIVLGAGKDPEDETRRYLMPIKENICAPSAMLGYSFHDRVLVWSSEPVSGVTVDCVMSGHAVVPDEDRDDAAEFLRDLLSDGQMTATDVDKAARGAGWTIRQLRLAQKRAGVTTEKSAFRGGWCWRIGASPANSADQDDSSAPKVTQMQERVILGGNSPVSALDSTVFPKMTGVSSSVSSSGPSMSSSADASSSESGWGEV